MKIALIGYGKMGKEIEQIALQRTHEIVFIADARNADFLPGDLNGADAAIEFSMPASAVANILKCFDAGIPVVVGTTGWYEKYEEIKKICIERNQALFTATNFSIGVNVFFEINRRLARLMNNHPEYEVAMEEIHHTQKLDAPSGTAISLANDILSGIKRKTKWIPRDMNGKTGEKVAPDEFEIVSVRRDTVPGTHIIRYQSEVDQVEIKHEAKNRRGFATGAVMAAEWIAGKKGVFGMSDLLKL